ncbi:CotH kinase family protein, partial [Crocinitomix sp.]|nr:CotH kinase family protein [Crocinitomix sp.]
LIDNNNHIETNEKSITYYSNVFSQLPIVHLTIDESDLFDWNKGIMISGSASTSNNLFYQDWWYRPSNFALRGSASARDVYFQYFNEGGLVYESAGNVKISGNATRYFPQKSLKIRAVDEKGRKTKFEFPFWGKSGNKKYESIVLRQSGNDNTSTLFADLLMHELAAESKVIILNGFPVSLFINGNYWGIYNVRERIDEYMLSKRVDADSKDITILKCEKSANIYRLVAGEEKEKQEFENLIQLINEEGRVSEIEYLMISERISLKSFIDYIFFETYFANQDWLLNNTTWFKAKGGQWKWILNDLDFSLAYPGEWNVNSNLFTRLLTKNSIMGKLFTALIAVDAFKEKFLKRSKKHLEEIFNEANLTEKFYQLKSKYEGDMQYEIDRWRSIDSYAAWEASCEANLTFLINRKLIYLKQLKDL